MGYAGIIGSLFTFTTGYGLAAKLDGKGQVAVCDFGDGHSQRGQFHEAMNLSALWKLPVVWVCENNQMAMFVPVEASFPQKDIAGLAAGYGIPGVVVDGQDVIAVYEAAEAAVNRARAGNGPTLLECKTYRIRPHTEGMPDFAHGQIRSKEEVDYWKKRDPIKLFEKKLLEEGVLTNTDLEKIQKKIDEEIAEIEQFVLESPNQDLANVDLDKLLYAD
jgi:pyruvate dehydrogenase E1 component alpha subunit